MTQSLPGRIKLICAFLLVVSAALPQYTCVQFRAPDGGLWAEIPAGADSSRYERVVERHYALENFDATRLTTWVTVLTFTWAAMFVVVRSRSRRPRLNAVLWWFEPLLSVASGYLILVFSDFGDRAIGAWVGAGASAGYLVAWLFEVPALFRRAPA